MKYLGKHNMIVIEKISSPFCLFFIHGMLCDAHDWQFQIDYFSQKYSVVACDLPGHGALSRTNHVSWDIPSLAAYLKEVIDSLDISKKIVLIGHSMATRIVVELSLLLKQKIAGIVLLDMGYQRTTPPTCIWVEEEKQHITNLGYKHWLQQFFNSKFGATSPPALREAVMTKAGGVSDTIGTALYLNTKMYDYYALEKALRLMHKPLLILQASFYYQGQLQKMIKGEMPKSDWLSLVSTAFPKAQVELIENCGHWLMLQQPKRCNSVIDGFLNALINN
jgi:pimeloyl-ACP methyl ester carboxylesterase